MRLVAFCSWFASFAGLTVTGPLMLEPLSQLKWSGASFLSVSTRFDINNANVTATGPISYASGVPG